MQVPWFQCVSDQCGYHFKEKFDQGHWPVRTTGEDGLPEPLTWTFDHGQNHDSYLWTYTTADGGRLRVQPKRAWPHACNGASAMSQCPSRHCMFHLREKAYAQHAHNQRSIARVARNAARRAQRATAATQQGNTSHQDDDEPEGDASYSQNDLGNDSGASSGPSQR